MDFKWGLKTGNFGIILFNSIITKYFANFLLSKHSKQGATYFWSSLIYLSLDPGKSNEIRCRLWVVISSQQDIPNKWYYEFEYARVFGTVYKIFNVIRDLGDKLYKFKIGYVFWTSLVVNFSANKSPKQSYHYGMRVQCLRNRMKYNTFCYNIGSLRYEILKKGMGVAQLLGATV